MLAVSEVAAQEECRDDADQLPYNDSEMSRTDLDSHANMPVLGRNSFILSDAGKTAEVSPFSPDYEPMEIKIVDGAIAYDC
eukprot:scaffold7890_cov71-Cylindrotheca_fusiformis.AAC.1